jgi:hypothetical protein
MKHGIPSLIYYIKRSLLSNWFLMLLPVPARFLQICRIPSPGEAPARNIYLFISVYIDRGTATSNHSLLKEKYKKSIIIITMRLYRFHSLHLPLVWILIFGLFIDTVNIDDVIGHDGLIHEEYIGESNVDMGSANIDIVVSDASQTHQIIRKQAVHISNSCQWIDEDSPSVAASVIPEGQELILLLKEQSASEYISSYIPASNPISLGKLLI